MVTANTYQVLGVMSGTSLDGLDIAYCRFEQNENWHFELLDSETIAFPQDLKRHLEEAMKGTLIEGLKLEQSFDLFVGKSILEFLERREIKREAVNAIANHGQTIFHDPKQQFTWQLSSPSRLAAITGIRTIGDFRTSDVALGGQGAPLVPIGDALLFSEYGACVNLGGFANLSCEIEGERRAWDICPVNFVMNPLAMELGAPFDDAGNWAREGEVNASLLEKLEALAYYKAGFPKSLGAEWVHEHISEKMAQEKNPKNALRTWVEHSALRIASDLKDVHGEILFTGGGAYNQFLMERIQSLTSQRIVIPEKDLIDFKEALVFGLLGALRMRGEVNCLASVTGALRNHSAGVVALP